MDPRLLPDGSTDQRFGPGGLHHAHEAFGPLSFIWHLAPLFFCLLVLAALIVLLYLLLSKPGGGWTKYHSAALRELEMRYARGEIGRDEFLQRRADLTTPVLPQRPPPGAPPPAAPLPPAQSAGRRQPRGERPPPSAPPPEQAAG
jgi:uncharacterized membrane protein